jgi:hypothetical protein
MNANGGRLLYDFYREADRIDRVVHMSLPLPKKGNKKPLGVFLV